MDGYGVFDARLARPEISPKVLLILFLLGVTTKDSQCSQVDCQHQKRVGLCLIARSAGVVEIDWYMHTYLIYMHIAHRCTVPET